MKKQIILSGIQASGKLHLGNYFGAIKQYLELQNNSLNETYYFIADFHALTTIKDANLLRHYVEEAALDYLALGLNPDKATFFCQSKVPEVTELAWILSTVTGMGLLERAHSYKDKIAKGLKPNVGLFYYPILMAADILIYKANLVPVGSDQVQHIEITQDIAELFNNTFQSEILVRPEVRFNQFVKVPGVDGHKMSKSYHNTIDLHLQGQALKKRVMSIVTDSLALEAPKNPDTCTVFTLYSLFATENEKTELANRYRAGGLGYGEVKKLLLEKIETYFAKYHQRRSELEKNRDYIQEVLKKGAIRARETAVKTLDECKRACGLN